LLHALVAMAASGGPFALRASQLHAWSGAPGWGGLQTPDLEGRIWKLPQPGRALALNFWASWCEPCRTEMPSLQLLADLYGDRLAVVALNFKERASTVTRFARSTGVSLPVLMDPDGSIAAALGVKVFPTTLLFGADGKPRWRVEGALDWTGPEAGRLVEGLWLERR
jgi:thiol-disulfide isomerase/thioredoxin